MDKNKIIYYSLISVSIFFTISASTFFNTFAQSRNKNFNIAAVGDISCGSNGKNTINTISNNKPNLTIFLGDLAYTKNIKCFFNLTQNLESKSTNPQALAVIGNHDIDEDSGDKNTKKLLIDHYLIPTTGYYSKTFDNGKILFVAMNFTGLEEENKDIKSLENEQYDFVKDKLQNSNITFKIVASHAPFISQNCENIDDTCHDSLEKWANSTFTKYHQLFKNTGVKLVLSGHNHNYQRSEKDGIAYIISGLGGKSQYDVIQQPGTQRFDDAYGYLNLSFNNKSIEGKFVDNNGNVEKDTFTIQ